MPRISINIPSSNVSRVATAIEGIYPIPLDDNRNPTHTDQEWIKKVLEDHIKLLVEKWEIREGDKSTRKNAKVADDLVGD